MEMKSEVGARIVYGPVPSRRLGKWKNGRLIRLGSSLGINLSRYKVCSFNCIYCSCGQTVKLTNKPSEDDYFSLQLQEIKKALEEGFSFHKKRKTNIEYISFVGWTEPTLHPLFDEVVDLFFEIKEKYFPSVPTAIFTNSTTLGDERVRKAIIKFDRAFFKLDAASKEVFREVNRAYNKIKLENIINNLIDFSKEAGKVELSAMILRTNYKDIASEKYIEFLKKIKPKGSTVYLCTPDWLYPEEGKEGISLMPKQEILHEVKNYLEDKGYHALILPPKRFGLHPLIKWGRK